MPVNWDNIDIDRILTTTTGETDQQLASTISSLTRMTDEEVKDLFPAPADVKKLAGLMKIVKSSEDRNQKINSLVDNAQELSGVVLTLLSKFV